MMGARHSHMIQLPHDIVMARAHARLAATAVVHTTGPSGIVGGGSGSRHPSDDTNSGMLRKIASRSGYFAVRKHSPRFEVVAHRLRAKTLISAYYPGH